MREASPWGLGDYWAPEPAFASDNQQRVKLFGAINETLSFRFALRCGSEAVPLPGLEVGPLVSTAAQIDSSAVSLFRIHPVDVPPWPGWHIRSIHPSRRNRRPLDVLVPIRAPRGGLPAELHPGETYYFWADVDVPKGTFEGTYTTEIVATSRGVAMESFTVELEVWPLILPDRSEIAFVAELDHRALFSHHVRYLGSPFEIATDDWRDHPVRPELDALLQSTLRVLGDHRLSPVLPVLAPIVKVGAVGDLAIDWSQYDAVAGLCMDGRVFSERVPVDLWPLPFKPVEAWLSRSRMRAPADSSELLRQYVAACVDHFEGNGWLGRTYAMVPGVHGPGPNSGEMVRSFGNMVDGLSRRVKILSPLPPQDMAPYGWVDYPYVDLSETVDIWMPRAQFFDKETMAAERAAGRRTWVALDRPPFSGSIAVHAPPRHTRVLSWQARQLGADVLFLGQVNRWPDAQMAPAPEDCVKADPNVLLYPGGPFGLRRPVASVRLKYLRRSLQDLAYCQLLDDRGLGHVRSTLGLSLAPYAGTDACHTHFADGGAEGWPQEWSLFEAARRIMARQLIKFSGTAQPLSRQASFADTVDWRSFMLATRRLVLSVDGTRVRIVGPAALSNGAETIEARVECSLTIRNGRRSPLEATVQFELPAGWSAMEANPRILRVPPNSSRRVTLQARTSSLPTVRGGFFLLPIMLTEQSGEIHRLTARVPFLSAATVSGSIRIDGDLSDWPPGTTNVASDFRLITGDHAGGGPAGGEPRSEDVATVGARPRSATLAFIARDEDFLYIAINCLNAAPLRDVPLAAEPSLTAELSLAAGVDAIETGGRPVEPATRRKRVEYDDFIPVGEELIEVLIDPLNAGTRSPSDLYHIVVKRTGVDLVEKGIRTTPPTAEVQHWPIDLEVATRVSATQSDQPQVRRPQVRRPQVRRPQDIWTVELRIPLASLGPLNAPAGRKVHNTVWAINITRYDVANQEFSTWSGAVRNAYDPLSLGNLYLP